MNFALKNILKIIKDYYTILVSIPPLLGGIWQIINLARISPSYIRFFSISQMLADGLIIIIFLFILFLLPFLNYYYYKIFITENEKIEFENVTNNTLKNYITTKKPNKYLGFFLYVISAILTIITYYINLQLNNFIEKIYLIWFIITLNSLILIIIIPSLIFKAENHLKIFDLKFSNKLKILNYICIIYTIILISNYYFIQFNRFALFPNNLVNQKLIKNKIQLEFPNSKIILIYNNDKYLFYKVVGMNKKSEKIKIVSFDKLFE